MSRLWPLAVVAVCLVSTAAWAGSSKQNPAASLEARDTGRIYYRSANVFSPRDAITRNYEGDVVIWGDLKFPQDSSGSVPAVIVMHGSGGVLEKERWLADELGKAGFATFVVDSHAPRGVSSTIFDQTVVSPATMVKDAYQALGLLATHPRIDRRRIGLVGASKGGLVSFLAAFEPIRKVFTDGGHRFAAHAALYASCLIQFKNPRMTGAPIQFQLGKLDEWTPPEECAAYAKTIEQTGTSIRVILYDGAYHGWGPGTVKRDVVKWSNCRFVLDDDGKAFDAGTGKSVDTRDAALDAGRTCAERQRVTLGAAADGVRARALKDLTDFLAANLKPKQ